MHFFTQIFTTAFALQQGHHSCRPHNNPSTSCRLSLSSANHATDNQKYQDMLEWLKFKGADINSKIEIRPSTRQGSGYGVFVNDAVEADELLFTIPRSACITLDQALQDEVCGKIFQKIIDQAGPGGVTVALAGFMAKEWLLTSTTDIQKNDTPFGPYLKTLPWARGVNNQEHILFWSNQEIETSLKGSMCYSEATALRDEVNLAIRVLNGIVKPPVEAQRRKERGEKEENSGFSWPWQAKSTEDATTTILEGLPEAVKGAFVCLLTRAFEDGDGDAEKLVPMLDMMQHSEDPSISHVMRKSDGSVQVRARKALEGGEELFNQYRSELEESMPYHRFFTRYGFVPGVEEDMMNLLQDKSSIFFAQKAEV